MAKIENKIAILNLIRDKKHILFCSFNDKISKANKLQEWKSILKSCQSLGLVPADKNYGYLRDSFWPNLKRNTLSKLNDDNTVDISKRDRWTVTDDLVIEILGKTDVKTDAVDVKIEVDIPESDFNYDDTQYEKKMNTAASPKILARTCSSICDSNKVKRAHERVPAAELNEQTMKKRKLELKIENLKLKKSKLKLKLLIVEKKLRVALDTLYQQ